MQIDILKEFEAPIGRMTGKGEQQKERFHQRGFAHFGGPFPVEIRIPLENISDYYPAGQYELGPESFRVGQYGDLQINPFNIVLKPLKKAELKQASGSN